MSLEAATRSWAPVNTVSAEALREARLQAHWALQTVAAVGETLVARRDDDSHAATTWLPHLGLLAGEPTPEGVRIALRPGDLTLVLLDGDGRMPETFVLGARTLAEAHDWAAAALGRATGKPPATELKRPGYDLPDHPTGRGEPFAADDPAALGELLRWFANASRMLEAVRASADGATAVRCWPHHFDIGLLVDAWPDDAERTIGMGLSPGDDSYDEPYFYVTPYPQPSPTALPAPPGPGRWHTEGWVGAVLRASDLGPPTAGAEQAKRAASYLESALAACRALVDGA